MENEYKSCGGMVGNKFNMDTKKNFFSIRVSNWFPILMIEFVSPLYMLYRYNLILSICDYNKMFYYLPYFAQFYILP